VPIVGGGGGGGGSSAWTRIYDTTLAVDTANFDFTAIPSSYAHLALYLYLRGDVAGAFTQVDLRINNDSGTNYSLQETHSATTAIAAANTIANNNPQLGFAPGNTAPANVFGAMIVDFLNYATTTSHKFAVSRSQSVNANSNGNIQNQSSALYWAAVAAINRLTIYPSSGANWMAGSRATLFGISAA
jgi:hypothetical protein